MQEQQRHVPPSSKMSHTFSLDAPSFSKIEVLKYYLVCLLPHNTGIGLCCSNRNKPGTMLLDKLHCWCLLSQHYGHCGSGSVRRYGIVPCDSLSGSSAVTSQYMASVSRMLPNDKLKVLPSFFVATLPSLVFFLFQFNNEAELWPLAPPGRRCRVFSLSLLVVSKMPLLSSCRHTHTSWSLHRETHICWNSSHTHPKHKHTVPVYHVSVAWPH